MGHVNGRKGVSSADEPERGGLTPHLEILEPLLGSWKGQNQGSFGTAQVTRATESVLDGYFVRARTKSVGENDVHEDVAFFSYDRDRNAIVLREFHAEGYVTHSVLTESDDRVLTFDSEHIENPFDRSLRSRTVIHLTEPILETMALATGDRPLEVCVSLTLQRVAHT